MSLPGHTQCGVHLKGGLHKATNSRESHTIAAFPGTAHDCFDDNCQPVSRPGGYI